MDYLDEARQILAGYSGKALDLERAQVYAAIAMVEALQDVARKLGAIALKLEVLSQPAEAQGEVKVAEAQPVRRRSEKK